MKEGPRKIVDYRGSRASGEQSSNSAVFLWRKVSMTGERKPVYSLEIREPLDLRLYALLAAKRGAMEEQINSLSNNVFSVLYWMAISTCSVLPMKDALIV
jgi:hypothetical protein